MTVGLKKTSRMVESAYGTTEGVPNVEFHPFNLNNCLRCKRFFFSKKSKIPDDRSCCNSNYVFESDPAEKKISHRIQKLKPIYELLKGAPSTASPTPGQDELPKSPSNSAHATNHTSYTSPSNIVDLTNQPTEVKTTSSLPSTIVVNETYHSAEISTPRTLSSTNVINKTNEPSPRQTNTTAFHSNTVSTTSQQTKTSILTPLNKITKTDYSPQITKRHSICPITTKISTAHKPTTKICGCKSTSTNPTTKICGCKSTSTNPTTKICGCKSTSTNPTTKRCDCKPTSTNPTTKRCDCKPTSIKFTTKTRGCNLTSTKPTTRACSCNLTANTPSTIKTTTKALVCNLTSRPSNPTAPTNFTFLAPPTLIQKTTLPPRVTPCKVKCAMFKKPTCAPDRTELERLREKLEKYGFTIAPNHIRNRFPYAGQMNTPSFTFDVPKTTPSFTFDVPKTSSSFTFDAPKTTPSITFDAPKTTPSPNTSQPPRQQNLNYTLRNPTVGRFVDYSNGLKVFNPFINQQELQSPQKKYPNTENVSSNPKIVLSSIDQTPQSSLPPAWLNWLRKNKITFLTPTEQTGLYFHADRENHSKSDPADEYVTTSWFLLKSKWDDLKHASNINYITDVKSNETEAMTESYLERGPRPHPLKDDTPICRTTVCHGKFQCVESCPPRLSPSAEATPAAGIPKSSNLESELRDIILDIMKNCSSERKTTTTRIPTTNLDPKRDQYQNSEKNQSFEDPTITVPCSTTSISPGGMENSSEEHRSSSESKLTINSETTAPCFSTAPPARGMENSFEEHRSFSDESKSQINPETAATCACEVENLPVKHHSSTESKSSINAETTLSWACSNIASNAPQKNRFPLRLQELIKNIVRQSMNDGSNYPPTQLKKTSDPCVISSAKPDTGTEVPSTEHQESRTSTRRTNQSTTALPLCLAIRSHGGKKKCESTPVCHSTSTITPSWSPRPGSDQTQASSEPKFRDIISDVIYRCLTTPSVDDTTVPPSVDDTTAPPSVDDATAPPSVDDTTVSSSVDDTTVPHSVDDTTVPPSVDETTVPCAQNNTISNIPDKNQLTLKLQGLIKNLIKQSSINSHYSIDELKVKSSDFTSFTQSPLPETETETEAPSTDQQKSFESTRRTNQKKMVPRISLAIRPPAGRKKCMSTSVSDLTSTIPCPCSLGRDLNRSLVSSVPGNLSQMTELRERISHIIRQCLSTPLMDDRCTSSVEVVAASGPRIADETCGSQNCTLKLEDTTSNADFSTVVDGKIGGNQNISSDAGIRY
nr:PREDICTED: mucin-2-like [Bemisia tabaci]